MTTDALWKRYAAAWSLPAAERAPEIAACLADDVTYCDPNGLLQGRPALSDYMEAFQNNVPGGRFHINSVLHHHDRSLAFWDLLGPDERILQSGVSFALAAPDGRHRSISGFFQPTGAT
jgi:hypothetical protein